MKYHFFKMLLLSGLLLPSCSHVYQSGFHQIPTLAGRGEKELSATLGFAQNAAAASAQAAWSPAENWVVNGAFSAFSKSGKDYNVWDGGSLGGTQRARAEGGYQLTLGGGWYKPSAERRGVFSLTGGLGIGLVKNKYTLEPDLIDLREEAYLRSTPIQIFVQAARTKRWAGGAAATSLRFGMVSFKNYDTSASYLTSIADEDLDEIGGVAPLFESGFLLRLGKPGRLNFQLQAVGGFVAGHTQKGAFLLNIMPTGCLGAGVVYVGQREQIQPLR